MSLESGGILNMCNINKLNISGSINFTGNLTQNGVEYGGTSTGTLDGTDVIDVKSITSDYVSCRDIYIKSSSLPPVSLNIEGNMPYYCNTLLVSSNIGIGVSLPTYPLHIVGTPNAGVSAYFQNKIIYESSAQLSDARIKKQVSNVNGLDAVQLLKQMQVKSYNYIDTTGRGDSRITGFVAQDMQRIFPECVKEITDFIPNIFCEARVEKIANLDKSLLIFTDPLSSDVLAEIESSALLKLRSPTTQHVFIVKVVSASPYQITIDKALEDRSVFVHGIQVHDLKVVDYGPIIAMLVGAVQQLLE
jgi:hypothetical protein